MQEIITVANVKCQGCAKSIREALLGIGGVDRVEVAIEEGLVTVQGDGLHRIELATALAEIGFPELTTL